MQFRHAKTVLPSCIISISDKKVNFFVCGFLLNSSIDYYGKILYLKCWFDWFNHWESILKLCLTDFSLCQRACRFGEELLRLPVKLLNCSLWYTSMEKMWCHYRLGVAVGDSSSKTNVHVFWKKWSSWCVVYVFVPVINLCTGAFAKPRIVPVCISDSADPISRTVCFTQWAFFFFLVGPLKKWY